MMSGVGSSMGHIALCKASVLYLGSAVPLETAVGVEAIQLPCRERFSAAIGPDMKVSGIDAVLTVYSSGLLMQYTGTQNATTWFPMQTLHVSSAVKACIDIGMPRFVPLDSPEAESSQQPPIFACITRRTKGIKILECHVFICKSTEAAMTLVQSTSYAYEHREGWLPEESIPPGPISAAAISKRGEGGARIFVDRDQYGGSAVKNGGSSGGSFNGFQNSGSIQKFSLSQNQPAKQPVPAVCPAPSPAPATQYVPVPVPVRNQYFSGWDAFGGQSMAFMPGSPFYPGDDYCQKQRNRCHHRCKKSKKKKKCRGSDESSDEEFEELYYVRKPTEPRREVVPRVCNDYVVYAPQDTYNIHNSMTTADEYSYYSGQPDPYYGETDYIVDYGAYGYGQEFDLMPPETIQYELEGQAAEEYLAALGYNGADPYGGDQYGDPYRGDPYGDSYGGDPYGYNRGGQRPPIRGYNDLVDGLGYYP